MIFHSLNLLLPALIPSWRFFDEIAPSPRIEYALLNAEQSAVQTWQEVHPIPARLSAGDILKNMVYNARWNERLYLVSCAERLMKNGSERCQREILERIQTALKHTCAGTVNSPRLQFRLVFITRNKDTLEKHITFISPVLPSGLGGD